MSILVLSGLSAMRVATILLLACLLAPAPATAATERHEMTADVVLSGDGRITGFTLERRFKGMEETLRGIVAKWRFQPFAPDGQPAEIHTTLVLHLHVERGEGDQEATARLEYRGQGSGIERLAQPRYPANALRAGVAGIVMLDVQHDAAGRVTGVQVHASRATGGKFLESFEAAATQTAKGWLFKPERVNGEPLPGKARVPVAFHPMNGAPLPVLPPEPPSPEAPLMSADGQLVLQSEALLTRLAPAGEVP